MVFFVKFMDNYYHLSIEDFEKFQKLNGTDFNRKDISSTSMLRVRELHNLLPSEVGLIRFPNKKHPIKDCKIPNYQFERGDLEHE